MTTVESYRKGPTPERQKASWANGVSALDHAEVKSQKSGSPLIALLSPASPESASADPARTRLLR
jgi:hypothetical protein